jgi:hypothetical protein
VAVVKDTLQDERIKMRFWMCGQHIPAAAVVVAVFRRAGSNAVEVAQAVRGLLPSIQAELPSSFVVIPAYDRSQTIVNSVRDVKETLTIAFALVVFNLAALRILAREIQQQDTAVESAARNLWLATARYRAGIDPYLNVITAQTTFLSNQQTAVTLRRQQMTASVQLVEALGGSWNVSDLPTATQVVGRGR